MSEGPAPVVIALHGFTRRPGDLDVLASECAARGLATLRPTLDSIWWPRSMNNASHLTRLAEQYAPRLQGRRCVVVGHSAGAAAGSWLGSELRRTGIEVGGFVYVDGNESPTHLIGRAWPFIGDLPIRAVCAPPSRCNRDGQLANWLLTKPGDVVVEVIDGSGHGDIEGRTTPVYRWACGDASSLAVRTIVMERTLSHVDGLLAGHHVGTRDDVTQDR